ncbi:hypothetical protein BWI97_02455 [Siphonobacter sp. BAB-5405]|nr:hypothetical protein BWI97_02455 [Siphonobacter sp. BAB-5405]
MSEFHSGAQAAYFLGNAVALSKRKSAVGVPAWDAPHAMPGMECIRTKRPATSTGRKHNLK